MALAFWERVVANDYEVPDDRPLAELTSELTGMLGDPDPRARTDVAYPTLVTWIGAGVYDDLLLGLGDGMAAGLDVGLGEDRTDTIFRRSYSALVLAECVLRDNERQLLGADALMTWGDRAASWLVREHDLRGYVHDKGWARALAHGADVLAALAGSPHMGRLELTVLLDVVADRLLVPTGYRFTHGEDDRLAHATMRILRRDLIGLEVLEPWVARLAAQAALLPGDEHDPYTGAGNVQAFLRSLHLQLALAPHPPSERSNLLLVLIEHLRTTNPHVLG